MNNPFLSLFKNKKPVIGVAYINSHAGISESVSRVMDEIETYEQHGVDGILIENHSDEDDFRYALQKICLKRLNAVWGIHSDPYLLRDSFIVAKRFGARFIKCQSIADNGIDPNIYSTLRSIFKIPLIGGIDLRGGMKASSIDFRVFMAITQCDAIALLEDYRENEGSLVRMSFCRNKVGNFPLVASAGIDASNIERHMSIADAAIIGRYFREGNNINNPVEWKKVDIVMEKINEIRQA